MVSIRKELAEFGLLPRKGLSQHFLTDPNILRKIIQAARIEQEDVVLEVGPGLGAMTLALAARAKRVIGVEIDPKLVDILRTKTEAHPNIEIIQADILKTDLKRVFEKEGQPIKVVANLPYKISTPVLFSFIESRIFFSSLTLMVQREVAERMTAVPGKKDYGPLSVFTQIVADLFVLFFIKPSSFFPPPKVDSAVIQVNWRKEPLVKPEDEEWFKQVVRASFGYRRKTLINALKHSDLSLPEDTVERIRRIGIDPQRRPETLTIEEFVRLAEALKE